MSAALLYTARQAANRVAAGAIMAYAPTHPELGRDYYFRSADAAALKLTALCAEYGWTGGEVRSFVRHEDSRREFVPDRSGCCRLTTGMVRRVRYVPVSA